MFRNIIWHSGEWDENTKWVHQQIKMDGTAGHNTWCTVWCGFLITTPVVANKWKEKKNSNLTNGGSQQHYPTADTPQWAALNSQSLSADTGEGIASGSKVWWKGLRRVLQEPKQTWRGRDVFAGMQRGAASLHLHLMEWIQGRCWHETQNLDALSNLYGFYFCI